MVINVCIEKEKTIGVIEFASKGLRCELKLGVFAFAFLSWEVLKNKPENASVLKTNRTHSNEILIEINLSLFLCV